MTETTLTIPKKARRQPSSSYESLRRRGLEHIQNLGNRLWTDYNSHDPGVTILESLCYALTDLSYRTQYSVEDLMADAQGAPGPGALFPARQILTCNAVTLTDLRSLLIDIPGIRNAWVTPTQAVDPSFYLDCKKSELTWTQLYGFSAEWLASTSELDDELREALVPLAGRYFRREEFKIAGEAALGGERWATHGATVIELAAVHQPVAPNGLFRLLLEFEDDPILGDLNQLKLSGQTSDSTPLPFQIFVENNWPAFRDKELSQGTLNWTPPSASALKYEAEGELYSCQLGFAFGDTLVELRLTLSHTGPQLETHRPALQAALAALAPRLLDLVRPRVERCMAIAEKGLARLHRSRSLTEDYLEISSVETEDLALCTDIELENTANVNQVAAEVEYRVGRFFEPRPVFYTLKEMLDAGHPTDEIFSGPALDHGFLEHSELDNSNLRSEIHCSDVIHIIMDIPGVVAVRRLALARWLQGKVLDSGASWRLPLSGTRRLHLDRGLSRVRYYKDVVPQAAQASATDRQLRRLRAVERAQRLGGQPQDLPIPRGKGRDAGRYQSVQQQFPLTYGIGPEGVPGRASATRKAEAFQLKAYLRCFDQLLADYLSQLANFSQLFSLEPHQARTYFGQPLFTLPDSYQVHADALTQLGKAGVDPATLALLEPLKGQATQSLSEMTALLEAVLGASQWSEHRLALLEAFRIQGHSVPELPRIQALERAFVQSQPPGTDWQHRDAQAQEWENYRFAQQQQWTDKAKTGDRQRESQATFERRRNAFLDHLMARFAEAFSDYALLVYDMDQKKAAKELIDDKCAFLQDYPRISHDRGRAFNQQGRPLAPEAAPITGLDISGYEQRVARLLGLPYTQRRRLVPLGLSDEEIDNLADLEESRAFHVLEHVLLRPRATGERLLGVATGGNCDCCNGAKDPYSFRMTAVVPAWPKRFAHPDFRRFVERTLRREAPAHTHVKVCWLSPAAMFRFESAYFPWAQLLRTSRGESPGVRQAREALVEVLCDLRSVHPSSRLGSCAQSSDEDMPALLNHSVLGSTRGVDDE